jgi:hypothetical protein
VPREVSDHAEASRDIRTDIGAVLETVGFDAAVRVQADGHVSTWPPGSATATTTAYACCSSAADSTSPHQK